MVVFQEVYSRWVFLDLESGNSVKENVGRWRVSAPTTSKLQRMRSYVSEYIRTDG